MAARRLIIVMLVLLGISSVIAVIVPEPVRQATDEKQSTVTGSTGATGTTGSTGETAERKPGQGDDPVEAEIGSGNSSRTIKAAPGDRLILTVDPGRDAEVGIPGLGLTGTTTAFAPVVFDVLLPPDPGRYVIRERSRGRLAEVVSSKRG